uniref:Formylglycine-generating enzyme, required for sulfatase activity, contains SUMF1/FGE domain n=1 Tax=Candidatus Kentrum sp. TC TaxID=2126339 RepID=A0A450YY57_9GAMM|nr:MAG: Formylglycine-generating enzyme, required for sulfatase activity, contains SUMF1/FGE domain [Candidatus Kentron sp. TC]
MPAFTLASTKWLTPLSKKLVSLEQKLAFGVRDKETEELRKISSVFGLSFFELTRYYIKPYCQYPKPIQHAKDRQPVSDNKVPVFSEIDTFLEDDALPARDGSRGMFIISEAGMGKTSLLIMMKLTHLMGFWPQGYHCLLLKIGKDTLEKVAGHAGKANTVLLLDALDEDPLAWDDIEQRLLSILAATGDYYRVIISCHARSFSKTNLTLSIHNGRMRVDSYVCPIISLAPFDHDQVVRYLAKRYPDHWHNKLLRRDNFMHRRAQRLVSGMESLSFHPLLLSRIHDILALGEAGIRKYDLYTFYRTLIEIWLIHQESKLRRQSDRPPNREVLWNICATVAVSLQATGDRNLSRAALKRLIEEFPMAANIQHFSVGEGSLLQRNADGDLWFFHYSIQEFLVAHGMLNGQVDVINDAIRVTDQLLTFLKLRNKTDFTFPERFDRRSYHSIPELHFYDVLTNGDPGPKMQLIPAGEFLMGSREGKGYQDERPRHLVRISTPFALGTWPITFAEYDYFCDATERKKPSDQDWGRRRRPVINVSWHDALDYCAWLSKETGQRYRLPSEAEWEYAARARTTTNYWWGDDFRSNFANCVGCDGPWGDKRTAPVGSFAPNPFGLYDTAGNVCEWTADCWHKDYEGAPWDGRVWERENPDDCMWRVVRGGSWISGIWYLRSTNRYWFSPEIANFNLGFRLVREIRS